VVCYWTAHKGGTEFCSVFDALLEVNPERVSELYTVSLARAQSGAA
jgi:hypothetical protein